PLDAASVSAAMSQHSSSVYRCFVIVSPLSHIVSVVTDQHGALDSFHFRKDIDKIGVVVLETHLKIDLYGVFLSRLSLDNHALRLRFEIRGGPLFGCMVGTVYNGNVWIGVRLAVDKDQQHQANPYA